MVEDLRPRGLEGAHLVCVALATFSWLSTGHNKRAPAAPKAKSNCERDELQGRSNEATVRERGKHKDPTEPGTEEEQVNMCVWGRGDKGRNDTGGCAGVDFRPVRSRGRARREARCSLPPEAIAYRHCSLSDVDSEGVTALRHWRMLVAVFVCVALVMVLLNNHG